MLVLGALLAGCAETYYECRQHSGREQCGYWRPAASAAIGTP